MSPGELEHRELQRQAVAVEADGQRALLAGDVDAAGRALREAVRLYRASWEAAPPGSYGRLIGMLKAAVIAGDAGEMAAYVRGEVPVDAESAPAQYAVAIAAVVTGDDDAARDAAEAMRGGGEAFARVADAVLALVVRDDDGYGRAVGAIVADFEARDAHLTGVAIADTAVMLERLAAARGMASGVVSPLLPP